MVTDPGTAVRPRPGRDGRERERQGVVPDGPDPGRLHALNRPRPVRVVCASGEEGETPLAVTVEGRSLAVTEVVDSWLVEDEWWRTPLARRYVQLLLADGRLLTLFQDLIEGGWNLQRYRSIGGPS